MQAEKTVAPRGGSPHPSERREAEWMKEKGEARVRQRSTGGGDGNERNGRMESPLEKRRRTLKQYSQYLLLTWAEAFESVNRQAQKQGLFLISQPKLRQEPFGKIQDAGDTATAPSPE
ncbi:Phosphatidylinositol 3,4,5-Trisphosphate-Dependent Rac Exchanger 1 Protein [Manis pentadactyla]|nr:Phosphatidylinositol 3,4,5-Trisphosphate-Dependent Rac Exchanger 1 Protein [Manis pentadactyla]